MSRTGVADPKIPHRKRSSFYIIVEGETDEGEQGFWVVDEDTGEERFTGLFTETDFWVLGAKPLRVLTLKRRLYGRSFKKGKPKGYCKERQTSFKTRPPSEVKRKRLYSMGERPARQLSREKEKVRRARKE